MKELTELINHIKEANILEIRVILNIAIEELMRRLEQVDFKSNQKRRTL